MTTDHIRTAADAMDEDGYAPAQFLLVTWDGKGVIRHFMTAKVGQDVMGHVADYRKALMQLNGAPGQVQ